MISTVLHECPICAPLLQELGKNKPTVFLKQNVCTVQGGAIASKNITINIETWMVSILMNFQLDLEAGKVDSLEKEPDHVGIFPSVDILQSSKFSLSFLALHRP